jgi:hypothetical protein
MAASTEGGGCVRRLESTTHPLPLTCGALAVGGGGGVDDVEHLLDLLLRQVGVVDVGLRACVGAGLVLADFGVGDRLGSLVGLRKGGRGKSTALE